MPWIFVQMYAFNIMPDLIAIDWNMRNYTLKLMMGGLNIFVENFVTMTVFKEKKNVEWKVK